MRSAGVVEVVDVSAERSPRFRHAGVGPKIDLLVFDRPPEPLDEHVVAPCALAVHADGDLVLLQQIGEGHTGELAALIRVEDLGLAVFGQSLLDSLDAECRVHGDREPPGQNLAAEPVDHGCEIDEAARHGDVRDTNGHSD